MSAEAGAAVLRDGGNAVDAAVAAVMMSFAAESALTGPGAGGFMLVHTAAGEDHLLDFFVAAPGLDGSRAEDAALLPVEIRFSDDATQVFHVGPASCGVPGTPLGLFEALRRFGTAPMGELAAPAAQAARDGVEVTPMQAYLLELLSPITRSSAECAAVYEPGGRPLRVGERLRQSELGDWLERFGAEGPDFVYRGDVGAALAAWVGERGGTLSTADLAAYRVEARPPARALYRGREILTNPPPSSGGILLTYALDLLARLDRPGDVETLVEIMESAGRARTEEFAAGMHDDGYLERFMAAEALEAAAGEVSARLPASGAAPEADSRLGSTTHVSVLDAEGACVSVTCSNGSSSGVVVPGTGVHLNNMLGEQDLNPLGYHAFAPGTRMPSMMSPTIVTGAGGLELGLGSGGSNRIRSAILQVVLEAVAAGNPVAGAVEAPRVHFEDGIVQAEPGVDERALERLERAGVRVERWAEPNVFFGGVHAVARDRDGALSGAGDPRRGGAVARVPGAETPGR